MSCISGTKSDRRYHKYGFVVCCGLSARVGVEGCACVSFKIGKTDKRDGYMTRRGRCGRFWCSRQGIVLRRGEDRLIGIHDRLPSESLCILMEKGEEGTGFSGRRSGEILCGGGCSKLHVEQSCIILSPRSVGPSSRRS